jgi:hypothetical protein
MFIILATTLFLIRTLLPHLSEEALSGLDLICIPVEVLLVLAYVGHLILSTDVFAMVRNLITFYLNGGREDPNNNRDLKMALGAIAVTVAFGFVLAGINPFSPESQEAIRRVLEKANRYIQVETYQSAKGATSVRISSRHAPQVGAFFEAGERKFGVNFSLTDEDIGRIVTQAWDRLKENGGIFGVEPDPVKHEQLERMRRLHRHDPFEYTRGMFKNRRPPGGGTGGDED